MNIWLCLLSAVIGYFIGNFSSAIFYSKIFAHEDVRNQGSGNAGAANMLRNYGMKMGFATFFTDLLKGMLAVLVGRLIGGEIAGYFAAVAVVIGHNWPALLKFKGGNGCVYGELAGNSYYICYIRCFYIYYRICIRCIYNWIFVRTCYNCCALLGKLASYYNRCHYKLYCCVIPLRKHWKVKERRGT